MVRNGSLPGYAGEDSGCGQGFRFRGDLRGDGCTLCALCPVFMPRLLYAVYADRDEDAGNVL